MVPLWFRWATDDMPTRRRPTRPARAPTVHRKQARRSPRPSVLNPDPPRSQAAGEPCRQRGTAPPIATSPRGLVGDFFTLAYSGRASWAAGPGRVSSGGGAVPPVGRRGGSKASSTCALALRLRAGGILEWMHACAMRRITAHRPAGRRTRGRRTRSARRARDVSDETGMRARGAGWLGWLV